MLIYKDYIIKDNEYKIPKLEMSYLVFESLIDNEIPTGCGKTIEECKQQIDEIHENRI